MADTAYTPRLRAQFDKEIRGKLTEQFGYANVMQVPRLDKVVLNMGVGDAVNDRKKAETAAGELTPATIARVIASLHDDEGNVAVEGLVSGPAAEVDYP